MAIVFSKDIAIDKLLMAYNNNIVEFNSDSALEAISADITGLGIIAKVYPRPDGSFYFNFLDYITAEINTKNFADDLQYNLVDADFTSFIYDVTNGCYKEGVVTFKINFIDTTSESTTRLLHFLSGVNQLENYKKNQILFAENPFAILAPVQNRSNNICYLKYWEGYPFEFSFHSEIETAINLKNTTNGLDYDVTPISKVNSLFLSDGRIDVTLEDFLPLVNGINKLEFSAEALPANVNLIIDKADSECGVYIKFLNSLGRWTYWLFSHKHYRNRNSKSLTEMDNDYYNLEDTISPTIQSGKSSGETIKCAYERLNEMQKILLDEISDSPKVLMFTGERFSKANINDWMEVNLKTSSFPIYDHSKYLYNAYLEFELPSRNTIKQ